MFWDSYQVEPLVEDPQERRRILSDPDWWHQRGLVFRNRELDAVADAPFAGGDVFTEPGRVVMRGLYISSIGDPDCFERALLWLRRKLSGPRALAVASADRPRA
jgi:hypothetical protein